MLTAQMKQLIQEDIAALNQQTQIKGKIGKVIGHGTYGFVCEWNDQSGQPKVVKIRDPEYIQKKNSLSDSELRTLNLTSTVSLLMDSLVADEQQASEKITGTKHKNLMTILNGTQYATIDDREVLLMVMPKLQTIQDLPVSDQREQQIVDILCDCCDGLHVLHQEPQEIARQPIGLGAMVHGDLKPDNIFVKKTVSDGVNTKSYMVGDYSSCLWLGELRKYPALQYPNDQGNNPYCAPGPIGIASDIWSLGWILWYWMNGKNHPTMDDVRACRKPDAWGDNPELWEVFLKMTDPVPARRYQSVDSVRAELKNAMAKRQERLAQEASDSDMLAGAISAVVAGGVGLLIYKGLSALFSNKTDGSGYYHGNIRKDIDLLEGTFRGEWYHGLPARGTFTYNGVRKSGNWALKENYQIPYSKFSTMTFSGLINVDHGEDFYHGSACIKWDDGTVLNCTIINGEFFEGIMTFAGGQTVQSQTWSTGCFTLPSGHVLEGTFCNLPHDASGIGKLTFMPHGVVFDGQILHNSTGAGFFYDRFGNRITEVQAEFILRQW